MPRSDKPNNEERNLPANGAGTNKMCLIKEKKGVGTAEFKFS
jgi:hypothetical protein